MQDPGYLSFIVDYRYLNHDLKDFEDHHDFNGRPKIPGFSYPGLGRLNLFVPQN